MGGGGPGGQRKGRRRRTPAWMSERATSKGRRSVPRAAALAVASAVVASSGVLAPPTATAAVNWAAPEKTSSELATAVPGPSTTDAVAP